MNRQAKVLLHKRRAISVQLYIISEQYYIKACIKEVPDYLSIKNILSLQNCIILVKLFDEKVHIYERSHNNFNKNKFAIKWL